VSKVILSIDPSTVRVGWATLALPLASDCASQLSSGWRYGSWSLRGDDLHSRMRSLEPLLDRVGQIGHISHLVVEKPTFFNSEAGRIATREGHIINLSIMLGYIMGRLELWGPNVTMYTPAQWKGMVPKDVTRKKFYRIFRDASSLDLWGTTHKYDHDTVDAIMLLHYWLTQRNLTRVKN
jgi:hypothetical protein